MGQVSQNSVNGMAGVPFPEVYYRRVDYSTESTQTMGTTGTNCRLGFRLMPIEYAMRVAGFCLSATTGVTNGTLMRLYLQAADPASPHKPYGAPLIDTGAAGFNWGDNAFSAALFTSTSKHLVHTLSAPVDIPTPGLYWLGVFTQTPASGGSNWRTANLRAYYKGLSDLTYTFGGADLAAIANASFATFVPPQTITTSVLSQAADTDPCCISIGLVCQRI